MVESIPKKRKRFMLAALISLLLAFSGVPIAATIGHSIELEHSSVVLKSGSIPIFVTNATGSNGKPIAFSVTNGNATFTLPQKSYLNATNVTKYVSQTEAFVVFNLTTAELLSNSVTQMDLKTNLVGFEQNLTWGNGFLSENATVTKNGTTSENVNATLSFIPAE